MLVPEVRWVPWGYEELIFGSDAVTVKVLNVHPGARLSLQRHAKRDEQWTVLSSDGGRLEIGGIAEEAKAGYATVVGRGFTHRASAPPDAWLRILEVSHGEFDQADIERLEDDYGRR